MSLRWCKSLAKAPLHATTRGAGLAGDWFPRSAGVGGSAGRLRLRIADLLRRHRHHRRHHQHRKNGHADHHERSSTIRPPCALAIVEQPREANIRYAETAAAAPHPDWFPTIFEADSNCVTQITDNAGAGRRPDFLASTANAERVKRRNGNARASRPMLGCAVPAVWRLITRCGRKSAGVGNCRSLLILGLRPY